MSRDLSGPEIAASLRHVRTATAIGAATPQRDPP